MFLSQYQENGYIAFCSETLHKHTIIYNIYIIVCMLYTHPVPKNCPYICNSQFFGQTGQMKPKNKNVKQ